MISPDRPNPFRILGLPTDATEAEIVERANEKIDLAETEEERLETRWALGEIITRVETRLAYELFEAPGAVYEDRAWDDFARRNGRQPADLAALTRDAAPPTVDQFDLVALTRLLLDGALIVPEGSVAAALEESPVEPGAGPPPLEVKDVIFG